jgi:hypothetical protein
LKIPTSHLVNPASTRRVIRLTHHLLPLLRRRARILAKKNLRAPFDPAAFGIAPVELVRDEAQPLAVTG